MNFSQLRLSTILILLSLSGLTFARSSYYQMANESMKGGDHQIAKNLFREEIKQNPQNYKAYAKLGLLEFDAGEEDLAIQHMLICLKLNPLSIDASYNLATMYKNQKKYKLALKYFKKAEKLRPNYLESKLQIANTHELLQNLKSAKNEYQNLLALNVDHTEHQLLYSQFLERNKLFKDAEDSYEKAIKLAKKSNKSKIRYSLALMLKDLPIRWEKALLHLSELKNDDSSLINEAYYYSATILKKQKKYDAAISNLKNLLKYDESSLKAHLMLGQISSIKGRYGLALKYYNTMTKISKKDLTAYEARVKVYIKQKLFDKAGSELYKMQMIDPNNTKTYVMRGWLFEILGMTNLAETEYKFAQSKDPSDLLSLLSLANLYTIIEKDDLAIKIYKKISLFSKYSKFSEKQIGKLIKRRERLPASRKITPSY